MNSINLIEKFNLFNEHWTPKLIADLNGQHVKIAKMKGEFVWHKHEQQDELFLVVRGRFRMEFREKNVWVEEGEIIVVPRDAEHRPVADEEAHILMFEPANTLNTGNVNSDRTVDKIERI